MYTPVAQRLAVNGDGTVEVSQPVSMEDANAMRFEFTVHSIVNAGTDVISVKAQGVVQPSSQTSLVMSPTLAPT